MIATTEKLKVSTEPDPENSSKSITSGSKWKGVLAVLGGFLIHLSLGNFYTLGNMSPYMMSYLKRRVDPTVETGQAIWINALSFMGQGLPMAFGGFLERKIGTRKTCLLGSCIFCGSIAFTFFAIKRSFIALALTYGLATCLGLSFSYVSALALGMRWFPNQKGLVNGIITAGCGLGTVVFNPVQTAFVNPDNQLIDSEDGFFTDSPVLDRVPFMFLYMAVIYAVVQAFSICILFSVVKPAEPKCQVYLLNVITTYKSSASNKSEVIQEKNLNNMETPKVLVLPGDGPLSQAVKDINVRSMFKHKEFYMLWFTFALHSQSIQYINTYYKSYGMTFIEDDHFLSTVGSVAGVCSCLGRIFWGRVQDKSSYKLCMLLVSIFFSSLMATFCLVSHGGHVMFLVWVSAISFIYGGVFSLMPTGVSQAFGAKNAGTNFGILFTAPALMSVCGAPLIDTLQDKVHWMGTLLTMASFNLTAFIVTLFVPWKMDNVRMKF